MLKTNFTKGEWEIGKSLPDHETDVVCNGKRICEVKHYKTFKSDPNYKQGIANAKLIAAAPELFEACERALEILEQENIFGQARLLLAVAIKKALS